LKTQVSILPLKRRNLNGFHFITWDSILVPDTLSKAGYTNVHIVPEQVRRFSNCKSPNQEPEALAMALALADKTNADIGTDLRHCSSQMTLLNGNQTMILMTAFY
jgi:hypothetical protein